ncbi:MAG: hypothetical protein ACLUVC_08250 [Longibaculum sp.]
MFYILMLLLFISFILSVLRQCRYKNQPENQKKLSILIAILLTVVIVITLVG